MYLDDLPTALYRLYGADDTLLYVGITADVDQRFTAHRYTAPWWNEVTRWTVEWHNTRKIALSAESAAINDEAPIHNVAGKPAPEPRLLGRDEAPMSQMRKNLSEYIGRARYAGSPTLIVGRGRDRKPISALVPMDLYEWTRIIAGLLHEAAQDPAKLDALKSMGIDPTVKLPDQERTLLEQAADYRPLPG